ncbi:MAG: SpoIID/LytB domain-containing protein [Armatimonadota bacterium]|nr:SpoIID/LytB domain-containing protein [Armatimonadota bacterium]
MRRIIDALNIAVPGRASPGVWMCLALVVAASAGGLAEGPAAAQPASGTVVRVGLLPAVDAATIGAEGPFDIVELPTGRRETAEGGRVQTRAVAQGIDLGGVVYAAPVRLVPRSGFLQVNGRPYRGVLELRRALQGGLAVINEVDLEEYLYGVVRSEMDPRWPPAALRAQAIAARSLALYWAGRFAAEGYDVRATTDSQVYGGVAAEDPRTTAAVDATRGLVMLYEGRPVFAAYHSDSGGATESSEYVWGTAQPYLRGVPDPYAQESPTSRWTVRADLGALEARLQRAGKTVAGLQRIEVAATSPSGRALLVRLHAATGATDVRGVDFRALLGVGVLRSTLFTVQPAGDGVVEFSGRGAGHGVGMSQWGARGQALQGRDYPDILRYYYTGVTIGTVP